MNDEERRQVRIGVALERLRELEDVLRRLANEAVRPDRPTDPERLHELAREMERSLAATYNAIGSAPSEMVADLLEPTAA
jgi:hypothetical protein